MDRGRTTRQISRVFFNFGKQLGFQTKRSKFDAMFTELFAIDDHALSVTIDWRDYYLDMFVIRRINGELPKSGQIVHDNRLCSIPIRTIYNKEPPAYPGINSRSGDALLFRLNSLITIVQEDPNVLLDFFEHIEMRTSVESTKLFFRNNYEHRLALLEEDHSLGRLDDKSYAVLRRSLLERLDYLMNK